MIIAVLFIAMMIISIGVLMHRAGTYYKHEPWEEYLMLIGNIELNCRRLVELSLANYTNSLIGIVERVNETENFVDNCASDVDGKADKGNHSSFTAQQQADPFYDTLTEEDTGSSQSWVSPTGHNDPNNTWTSEINSYDDDTGTNASTNIPSSTWSDYIELTVASTNSSKVQYYVGRESDKIDQMVIDIYNTTWINIYSGAGIWDAWTNVTFTETTLSKIRFRFHNSDANKATKTYLHETDFLSTASVNYQIDLEVQWTTADHNQTEQELCIRTGFSNWGSEELRVDVWNISSSSWDTLINDLNSNDWNNISISDYVNSSTLTIRFKAGSEINDQNPDSWDIECSLIHTWSTEIRYIPPTDSQTVLRRNLQKYQTNLSRMYLGRQVTLTYLLGNDEKINYTNGLAYDWCKASSFSAANVTFTLDIASIGFTDYKFMVTPFLNVTILPNCTSNQIFVAVRREENRPITTLNADSFELDPPNNVTSVSSRYDEEWTHIYIINYEGNIDPPEILWVWDRRGIKVTSKISEDKFAS